MAAQADAPGKAEESAVAAQLAELAEAPAATKAWISSPTSEAGAMLTVLFAQRNLASNRMRKYTVTSPLPSSTSTARAAPSPPQELGDVQLLSFSPSGMLARR